MKWITVLYWYVLRTFGLGERRCGWCKKFQGWKRVVGPEGDKRPTTHGICKPCLVKFEAGVPLAVETKLVRVGRRQRVRRSTLRRRTGGWSGAVASCGRVS